MPGARDEDEGWFGHCCVGRLGVSMTKLYGAERLPNFALMKRKTIRKKVRSWNELSKQYVLTRKH